MAEHQRLVEDASANPKPATKRLGLGPSDIGFESAVQAFFTRGSYYAVMGAEAEATYVHVETAKRISATHTGGPWHTENQSHEALFASIAAYRRKYGLSRTTVDTLVVQEPPSPNSQQFW